MVHSDRHECIEDASSMKEDEEDEDKDVSKASSQVSGSVLLLLLSRRDTHAAAGGDELRPAEGAQGPQGAAPSPPPPCIFVWRISHGPYRGGRARAWTPPPCAVVGESRMNHTGEGGHGRGPHRRVLCLENLAWSTQGRAGMDLAWWPPQAQLAGGGGGRGDRGAAPWESAVRPRPAHTRH